MKTFSEPYNCMSLHFYSLNDDSYVLGESRLKTFDGLWNGKN